VKVVDSCGWLEYYRGGPLAETYREHVLAPDVLVPAVALYEVCKIIRRERSPEAADEVAVDMRSSTVIELDESLALHAAELSLGHRLAMADAMVYATAMQYDAELVTSDADLAGLPGVTYLERPS
jgi:predicted nucleic acid-binding protein